MSFDCEKHGHTLHKYSEVVATLEPKLGYPIYGPWLIRVRSKRNYNSFEMGRNGVPWKSKASFRKTNGMKEIEESSKSKVNGLENTCPSTRALGDHQTHVHEETLSNPQRTSSIVNFSTCAPLNGIIIGDQRRPPSLSMTLDLNSFPCDISYFR